MTDSDLAPDVQQYTRPAPYIDSDSPEVRDFVEAALEGIDPSATKTEITIRLFEAVRERIRYDPYSMPYDPALYHASAIAGMDAAFCVPKAILLTACLRAVGIPAALGFADVKNHLNTPKLAELMGTDLFIYHGYVQVWLDGKTFKITPAFNMELCRRFGVMPLEFDGTKDALFHEFDQKGRKHMQYVKDRGIFVDVPIDALLRDMRATYPKLEQFYQDKSAGKADAVKDAFSAENTQSKGSAQ